MTGWLPQPGMPSITPRSVNEYATDRAASPEMKNIFHCCHKSDMMLMANEGEGNAQSDPLLKWRCTLADPTPLYDVLDDSSTKENLRTLFLLHGEDEESCYKQTVS